MGLFTKKEESGHIHFYVIDDEPEMVNIVRMILENGYPCSVSTFPSLDDAMADLKGTERKPDVILTDIRMPGRSGWELPSALEELGLKIPHIFFTGMDGEEIDDGDVICVSKPFTPEHLRKFVDRILAESPLKFAR